MGAVRHTENMHMPRIPQTKEDNARPPKRESREVVAPTPAKADEQPPVFPAQKEPDKK